MTIRAMVQLYRSSSSPSYVHVSRCLIVLLSQSMIDLDLYPFLLGQGLVFVHQHVLGHLIESEAVVLGSSWTRCQGRCEVRKV